MVTAGSDVDDVDKTRGNRSLTGTIVTPGDHRPIVPQSDRMGTPHGDFDHAIQACRNARAPVRCIAPGDHRAIGAKRHQMGGSRFDGNNIGGRGRNLQYAVGVRSPNDDLTIVEDRRTEVLSRRDPPDTRQTQRDRIFPKEIDPTDPNDRPIGSNTKRMGRTSGHSDQVSSGGSRGEVTTLTISDKPHFTIGQNYCCMQEAKGHAIRHQRPGPHHHVIPGGEVRRSSTPKNFTSRIPRQDAGPRNDDSRTGITRYAASQAHRVDQFA